MIITWVLCVSVLIFILTIWWFSLVNKIDSQFSEEKEKYEKYIGEKHIIDNDTLTIIDYSIFKETFTLSNGQSVNYNLVSNEDETN